MRFLESALMVLLLVAGPVRDAFAQKVVTPGGYREDNVFRRERNRTLEKLRVRVARVMYGGGGDWYSDPSSLPNLLRGFRHRTGIPTADTEKVLEICDPDLFSCPFLYMTGHGNIRLTNEELMRLRHYLMEGGFLYADDNYGMDTSFRRMVGELFPERRLVVLPLDHPIYNCFYDLEGPPKIHEHEGKPPQGLGVFNGDRLMIFYTYESDV
ncbi:MAG: DUF4159 domain-containing protein, partial [Candidatus Krumholzibacteria bacterium]|nr:DUF4159 domain-containing protein [Candidatus Krumholzibacteria bacterium]